jgi:D-alanyl-D-alanine dipeptidase
MKLFTAPRFKFDIFASCTSVNDVRACFHSLDLEKQEELKQANRTYVSWPSTDPASPSPHFTGGSVDVWLYEDKTMADLGVPFDWMEENAGAFYHLRVDRQVFSDDEGVCRRRTILLNAMLRAGFTAYPPEIWHFNYGNQMDAMVKGLSEACYSGTHP